MLDVALNFLEALLGKSLGPEDGGESLVVFVLVSSQFLNFLFLGGAAGSGEK
jgi:hypothetical protein